MPEVRQVHPLIEPMHCGGRVVDQAHEDGLGDTRADAVRDVGDAQAVKRVGESQPAEESGPPIRWFGGVCAGVGRRRVAKSVPQHQRQLRGERPRESLGGPAFWAREGDGPLGEVHAVPWYDGFVKPASGVKGDLKCNLSPRWGVGECGGDDLEVIAGNLMLDLWGSGRQAEFAGGVGANHPSTLRVVHEHGEDPDINPGRCVLAPAGPGLSGPYKVFPDVGGCYVSRSEDAPVDKELGKSLPRVEVSKAGGRVWFRFDERQHPLLPLPADYPALCPSRLSGGDLRAKGLRGSALVEQDAGGFSAQRAILPPELDPEEWGSGAMVEGCHSALQVCPWVCPNDGAMSTRLDKNSEKRHTGANPFTRLQAWYVEEKLFWHVNHWGAGMYGACALLCAFLGLGVAR